MQAIVIPPTAHLETAYSQNTHLLLTHLLSNSSYREFYMDLRRRRPDDFISLDNSAHEHGEGELLTTTLSAGRALEANEIVIPDALFDRELTQSNASRSFQYLLESGAELFLSYTPRLMIVPQGNSQREYIRSSRDLTRLGSEFQKHFASKFHKVPDLTIGISKDYEIWPGGLPRLLGSTILPHVREMFETTAIHILGWGHNLWAYREIAELWGEVIRSTDSAKPWVYAWSGIQLNPRYIDIPIYPKRPDGYFEGRSFSDEQQRIAGWNARVFQATVRGEVL